MFSVIKQHTLPPLSIRRTAPFWYIVLVTSWDSLVSAFLYGRIWFRRSYLKRNTRREHLVTLVPVLTLLFLSLPPQATMLSGSWLTLHFCEIFYLLASIMTLWLPSNARPYFDTLKSKTVFSLKYSLVSLPQNF